MIVSRRSFLRGGGALLAAPAIVRVTSIMPVTPWDDAALWRDAFIRAAEQQANPPAFLVTDLYIREFANNMRFLSRQKHSYLKLRA